MKINSDRYTIFNNRAAAEKVVADMDENEYRIEVDPKGSGRAIIFILDEESGEVIGKL